MSTHAALLGREEPTLTSLLARFTQMTLIETPEAKCFYKPKPINPGPKNPPTNWNYMAIPIILCLIICALLFRKYRDKVSYCFRSFGRTFTRQEHSIAMLPLAENRQRSNYFALLSDSDTSEDSERTPIIRNAR